MVFLAELQAVFAGLEEHFNVPAFAVDADNFLLAEAHICAYQGKPVLGFAAIAYTYYSGINGCIFPDYLDLNGKKISGTSTAFLAGSINLLYVTALPIEKIPYLG